MNLSTYENTNTLFFVSGMFAGGWIWDETYKQIPTAARCHIMQDPLCKIGSSVNEISEKIIGELNNIDQPVTLIGNSLGSFVCMNIASLVPEKVSRVIISGSAGFGEVTLPIRISPHNADEVAKLLVELICFDQSKVTEAVISKTAESFAKNCRNIARLMRESNALKAADILPNIKCPIYAFWGRDDVITPLSSTLELFKHFNIQLNIINQCGHSPMYEKPNEFSALIKSCI
ncbi:MAG: alpha/beta hydrolase [Candidatus Polarisedimenticolaceae bacterium]|nr:alpha/beta hydrolase [Candidatus Polarisedimenticolaceae bacterium]